MPSGLIRYNPPVHAASHALEMSFRIVEVVKAGLLAQGVDQSVLLAKYALHADGDTRERRVPHAAVLSLLEDAARVTRDPCFGVHAAQTYQPGAHVFEYLALNSPTLGDLLTRVCRYYRLIIDAAAPVLEIEGDHARWHFRMPGHEPVPPQLAQLVMTTAVLAGRRWMGLDASPKVVFAFAAPSDLTEYTRVLGPLVSFGGATHHLQFPSLALSLPLRTANPDLFALLDDHAAMLLRQRPAPDDLVTRIKQLVADGLESGDIELEGIAKKLHTSGRTLRRRLLELGTNHRALVDEVRAALAEQYLANERLSLEDIAYLLGFSDPSAFHRAFKRWAGRTPNEHRRMGAPSA